MKFLKETRWFSIGATFTTLFILASSVYGAISYANYNITIDETTGDASFGEKVIPHGIVADKDKIAWANYAPKIVAYGDSNTRYYQGDTSTSGPIQNSYGLQLDTMLKNSPLLAGGSVVVKGYPGQTASYGATNYDTIIIPEDPDILIIAWGTNDIKVQYPDLDAYLANITTIITNAQSSGVMPIVLGIPWFYEQYGYNTWDSQALIPIWDEELRKLCLRYEVPYIDTWKMFKDDTDLFFNEAIVKRHYSVEASKVLAQKIYNTILDSMSTGSEVSEYKHIYEAVPQQLSQILLDTSFNIYDNLEHYTTSEHEINTLKIEAGEHIDLNLSGKFALTFYPKAVGNVTVSSPTGAIETFNITNTQVDGLYYPEYRKAYNVFYDGNTPTTITVNSGTAYLGMISTEQLQQITTGENKFFGDIDVFSDTLRLRTSSTPATAGDTCSTGEIVWDDGYIYVCVDTDTWKKVAITTW